MTTSVLSLTITGFIVISIIILASTLISAKRKSWRKSEVNAELSRFICESKRKYRESVRAEFGCGAKVRFLEGIEILDATGRCLHEQPEELRRGGLFVDCNAHCPMANHCAFLKQFGEMTDAKARFTFPAFRGKRLESELHDGHWAMRLVDDSDHWIEPLVVYGLVFHDDDELLAVIPPAVKKTDAPLEEGK